MIIPAHHGVFIILTEKLQDVVQHHILSILLLNSKVIKIGNVYIEVPANFKNIIMKGLKLISVIIFLCTLLVACTEDADVQNIVSSHQNTWKSPLSRTIENPITTPDFKRTYGVGFSYDGLHGELCNLKDIKSQVLDYQKVKEALNGTLIKTNSDNSVRFKQYATFNRDEFYQHTMFKADLESKLIIFNGKIEGDVSLIEKEKEMIFL